MKIYKISESTLQATLDYLARCKYLEVFQLIKALQGVEEIKESQVPEPKVTVPLPQHHAEEYKAKSNGK